MSADPHKTRYIPHRGEIIGITPKVASTTLFYVILRNNNGVRKDWITQQAAVDSGLPVNLIVRDPLDRLVSGFHWFRDRHTTAIREVVDNSMDDSKRLLGCDEYKNIGIEAWFDVAKRYYNDHWCPQSEYHSLDGNLVATKLWPLESLLLRTTHKEKATKRKPTEEYFKNKAFLNEVSDYYAADIELYARTKENWNGQAPSILRRTESTV